MEQLVQCVPNFSEGRNAETVRALVAAVRDVPGVLLIDEEMDHDHHRAVLTFVGPPEQAAEAAFQAARTATALIDLRTHQGGHPRVGATDVVPFIPIRGTTIEECVALARQVGERIGRELTIPVFLYERAARRSEHANLEVIRRGGLEGLASRMEADPEWLPDFGPPRLHPTAGAVVVGARPPLIAYNVNLKSRDLEAAKAIAKKIRFSNGGLPHVKAIGVELASRGNVQVSMNLTNVEVTPIHVAYQAVAQEALARGIEIVDSEVIGLIPRRALTQAAIGILKLARFDPTQVLETRLERVLSREAIPPARSAGADTRAAAQEIGRSLLPFLDAVSSGTPTPGGGSVAALAGALAASLGLMACRIGADPKRPSRATDETTLKSVEQRLLTLQPQLQDLIQADAEAYAGVMEAYRASKEDPGRPTAISRSLVAATDVPLKTARLSIEAATLLRTLFPSAKPAVNSDLKVALGMAMASIEGGLENVRTNVKHMKDQELIKTYADQVKVLEGSLVELKSL